MWFAPPVVGCLVMQLSCRAIIDACSIQECEGGGGIILFAELNAMNQIV